MSLIECSLCLFGPFCSHSPGKQLPWGDQSSLAAGQKYACSENSWKNWPNTQKELGIMFPRGFCLNKIQNGDLFPTENSNLLYLTSQDG